MRDPNRIPTILAGIGAIWFKHPDWRFGQLIENLLQVEDNNSEHRCIFHIEDDETLEILRNAIRVNRDD